MRSSSRQRQLQKERKEKKRKEKKQQLARLESTGIAERLKAVAHCQVLHCWLSVSIEDEGIGYVLLSRQLPDGRVAVGVFLIDRYCLGLKDGFGKIVGRAAYTDKFERGFRGKYYVREVSPAEACKLVHGAIQYAGQFGFSPHPDAVQALPIFGSINPDESAETFEFGQNGKPYFISGPYDSPQRCNRILATLRNKCGPDGFHYLVNVGPGATVIADEEPADYDEIDDNADDWSGEPIE